MTPVVGDDERSRSLAKIVQSLDRCPHGRHEIDPCSTCPDGLSAGNPHLSVGQKLGYDVHGEALYLPAPEQLSEPGAWTKPPADVTARDEPLINKVYRERNRLVAGYTYRWPSVIVPAPDYPDFHIVYIVSPAGQLSWHIPPRDMDLFEHVAVRESWEWDGHSNEEKEARLELACRMWKGKA